jgi:hypothetical protein
MHLRKEEARRGGNPDHSPPLYASSSLDRTSTKSHCSHGSPEMLREIIAEQLWFVARLVELAAAHLEVGDDIGLRYDLRRLRSYMNGIVEAVAELPHDRNGGALGQDR